jgi:hypothetical protein
MIESFRQKLCTFEPPLFERVGISLLCGCFPSPPHGAASQMMVNRRFAGRAVVPNVEYSRIETRV